MTKGSSRRLVDPQLLGLLDAFAPLVLTMDTLEAVRGALGRSAPDRQGPREVDVVRRRAPGPRDAPSVEVLVYRPSEARGPLPCILHMHGGGFVFGAAAADEPYNRELAHHLSCCIVSLDYRLAPEAPFPAAIEDSYAVLSWIFDQAGDLAIDTSRLGVMGESAGGGLAAALCLMARDRGEYALGFQHLISPMLDDRTGRLEQGHAYGGDFIWTAHNNRFGWSALLGADPGGEGVSPYASAARAEDLSGLPPCFLAVGALDLLLPEGLDYACRLGRAGAPIELHAYPGAFHAFDYHPSAYVAAQARRDSRAALARALRPTAATPA